VLQRQQDHQDTSYGTSQVLTIHTLARLQGCCILRALCISITGQPDCAGQVEGGRHMTRLWQATL
jgi:hypothetical protein